MPDALRQFKAELFQALGHPVRVAIVELLVGRERSAGQLIELLALNQANVSQHLAVLRARQVVLTRKEGNQVFYRLRDPVLGDVLDMLRQYFYAQFSASAAMLHQLEPSRPVPQS
ncbi:MAG: metalloregulator ArsR/SmtB family transcription factor [Vicinamibacterales bacterium]